MILADTSIWIDHLRYENPMMRELLSQGSIMGHPMVAAELAMGSIADRGKILASLDRLPQVRIASLDEVREMIEFRSLYSRGIGLIDAHLLASVLIDPASPFVGSRQAS